MAKAKRQKNPTRWSAPFRVKYTPSGDSEVHDGHGNWFRVFPNDPSLANRIADGLNLRARLGTGKPRGKIAMQIEPPAEKVSENV